jgi:hypothetical protein
MGARRADREQFVATAREKHGVVAHMPPTMPPSATSPMGTPRVRSGPFGFDGSAAMASPDIERPTASSAAVRCAVRRAAQPANRCPSVLISRANRDWLRTGATHRVRVNNQQL